MPLNAASYWHYVRLGNINCFFLYIDLLLCIYTRCEMSACTGNYIRYTRASTCQRNTQEEAQVRGPKALVLFRTHSASRKGLYYEEEQSLCSYRGV